MNLEKTKMVDLQFEKESSKHGQACSANFYGRVYLAFIIYREDLHLLFIENNLLWWMSLPKSTTNHTLLIYGPSSSST
jgi:hypothetical protein